ncbi:MAG: hypothetical protein H8E85_04690 [Candidatus Marinimicrobia bacterium]|nr:hypothetical protein [Candidatus Neomarinimicrobiota bacterium]
MKQILLFSFFIFNFSFSQDTLMVQGTVQGMFYIPECMCAPFVLVDDSMNINYAMGTTPYESVAYQEYADQQVIITGVLSEYICEGFCDEVQPALQVISIELAETEPDVTLSFDCPEEVVAGSEGNTISIIMENEVYVGGIELYIELSSQNIEITNIVGGELVYINYTSWYYSDSTQIYILSFSIGTGLMIPPGVGLLFNIEFSGLDLGGDVQLEFSNVVMEGSNPNPIENIDYSDTCTISVVEPDPQIGDMCESTSSDPGFLDCEKFCIDEVFYDQWLGDGYCDESWGITFNCEEFGYDCGDCNSDWDGTDPLGFCGDDCTLLGDVNLDWEVNILDVIIAVNCAIGHCGEWMTECEIWALDVNGDGNLNILDIVIMVNIILSGDTLPDDCYIEPDIGPCDGSCPKYFFDPDSEECEVFFWGCCEGVVPFDTLEECQEACE